MPSRLSQTQQFKHSSLQFNHSLVQSQSFHSPDGGGGNRIPRRYNLRLDALFGNLIA
jgi:hypothetical protein